MREVTVEAPGKINLFLAVGPLRADGYHDVATVYHAVSLLETVSARHADQWSVVVSAPKGTGGVPQDESNLAVRAGRVLAAHLGEASKDGGPAADLAITKRVPVAGGMGGGSADAAAALVACDVLWGARSTRDQLERLAAVLGADIPFSLAGHNAVGTGTGSVLAPLAGGRRFDWVLVEQDFGLSTPEVYRELDRLRAGEEIPEPEIDPLLLEAAVQGGPDRLAASMRNDLQRAAFSLRPELGDFVREVSAHELAVTAMVSGSGPTVAVLCRGSAQAAELAAELGGQGWRAHQTHGPVPGAMVVGRKH